MSDKLFPIDEIETTFEFHDLKPGNTVMVTGIAGFAAEAMGMAIFQGFDEPKNSNEPTNAIIHIPFYIPISNIIAKVNN